MKNYKKILLFGLSILTLGSLTTGVLASKENISVSFASDVNKAAGNYYSSISDSLRNQDLLKALQSLNSSKLTRRVGYDNMWSYYNRTDPGDSSNTYRSYYSGKSAKQSAMNKEHVWPASRTVLGRDNDPLEDDIHMVRPTLTSENSNRGNSFFAESGAWDPATFNNPAYRGDAARIIFYCVVADPQLKLVDMTNDSSSNHTMGKLSDLLKWNLQYPVQNSENTRNEAAMQIQGNRNPFIDHPEYACHIWGKQSEGAKEACGYDKVSDFYLTAHSKTINVGDIARLNYVLEPEELESTVTIEWSSSNTEVADISVGGTITAKKAGETTITARIVQYNIYDTCKITVSNGGSSKASSGGCGGNIITTSVLLSTISLTGIAFLLISRRIKNEK